MPHTVQFEERPLERPSLSTTDIATESLAMLRSAASMPLRARDSIICGGEREWERVREEGRAAGGNGSRGREEDRQREAARERH
jgi:hypothetical protein